MPTGDSQAVSHSHSLVPTTTTSYGAYYGTNQTTSVGYGYYPGSYPASGYTCSNCGQWISHNAYHTCYYYSPSCYPVTQIYIEGSAMPPTVVTDEATKAELAQVKEELKEVRKTLEKLMELALNGCEEVRGSDNGRGEDPASDSEGSLEGTFRFNATEVAAAARRLGL